VTKSDDGAIELLFERLVADDWTGYGQLLSPDVERIGPCGDRMVGRDRLVAMMADVPGTTWDVHRIVYSPDGKSAFARVTARPARGAAIAV